MRDQDRLVTLIDRLRQLDLEHNPLDRLGISPAQMLLLIWIARCPGCRMGELAEGLGLTPPTVSVSVRRLERAGLLSREADTEDQRAIRLHLTERGQASHDRIMVFRRHKMQQLLSGLGDEEKTTFLSLFEKAMDAAETHSESRQHDESVIHFFVEEDGV
jgi:DNA-binding MarR family transcriptional regulator